MKRIVQRPDFVDTAFLGHAESVVAMPAEGSDPLDWIAWAERADWALLRLVVCAALATLLLALATSLIG